MKRNYDQEAHSEPAISFAGVCSPQSPGEPCIGPAEHSCFLLPQQLNDGLDSPILSQIPSVLVLSRKHPFSSCMFNEVI